MNVSRIFERRRSIDEVTDLAVAYSREHFRDLAGPLAWLCLSPLALIFLTQRALDLDWGRTWILALIESAVVARISIGLFASHLGGQPAKLAEALRVVLDHPSVLVTPGIWPWLALLAIDPTNGPALSLGLGSVMVAPVFLVRGAFAHTGLILEQLTLRKAITRSIELTRHRAPRTLGVVFVGALISGGCSVILDQLVVWVAEGVSVGASFDTLAEDHGSWGAVLGLLIAAPFVQLLRVLEFLDARTEAR